MDLAHNLDDVFEKVMLLVQKFNLGTVSQAEIVLDYRTRRKIGLLLSCFQRPGCRREIKETKSVAIVASQWSAGNLGSG